MTEANSRIAFLAKCIALIFFVITARLIYLQINLTDYFTAKSTQNFTRIEKIQSPRGNILDINSNLLATNRPVTNLYWQGTGNKKLGTNQHIAIEQLAAITKRSDMQNATIIRTIEQAERYHKQILFAKDIPFDQLSKIEELFPDHPNIRLKTHFERFYPYNSCASHILGYLGCQVNVKLAGQMGLEKLFETMLKGQPGTVLKTINFAGQSITQTQIKQELAGTDIRTTLDIQLQAICEQVFPQELCGSAILMNPIDGSLLAVVSRPNFNPALFLNPINNQAWQDLQRNQPFIDRAFNVNYPPGSIFKLITISAALEQNIIDKDALWDCTGYITFGKRKYWCSNRYGHGKLSTRESIAQSCNKIFFEIGKKIDIDLLAQYAYKFGLGLKTNSLFPEKMGIVPTRSWKQKEKGEQWWQGETLSVTIGQSYLLATPIQIARMISSIFTGTLVTPRILSTEPIQTEPLTIKPETLNFLQKSMRAVVTKGTGKRVKSLKDFKIYAKTSTAQTSALHKRSLGQKYLEHAWFVLYFQYLDQLPLTLIVIVEHAGTSRVPAIITKNFLINYQKHITAQTDPNKRAIAKIA